MAMVAFKCAVVLTMLTVYTYTMVARQTQVEIQSWKSAYSAFVALTPPLQVAMVWAFVLLLALVCAVIARWRNKLNTYTFLVWSTSIAGSAFILTAFVLLFSTSSGPNPVAVAGAFTVLIGLLGGMVSMMVLFWEGRGPSSWIAYART